MPTVLADPDHGKGAVAAGTGEDFHHQVCLETCVGLSVRAPLAGGRRVDQGGADPGGEDGGYPCGQAGPGCPGWDEDEVPRPPPGAGEPDDPGFGRIRMPDLDPGPAAGGIPGRGALGHDAFKAKRLQRLVPVLGNGAVVRCRSRTR